MDKKLIAGIVKDVEGAMTTDNRRVTNWLDTGNYALNYAITETYDKGLPLGRVVDICGDPSTGKSLLIYHLIANIQRMGGIAILDDTEDSYTKEFGDVIGIDNTELIRLNSATVDEHFGKVFLGYKDSKGKQKKSILELILDQEPDIPVIIALDSLALLSTKHEVEAGFGARDMTKAQEIRKGLRLASPTMENTNVIHVISNHVIAKIGVMFGKKKTTPGGQGVPFQASVRLECSLRGKIKDDNDHKIGTKAHVEVTKNKISAPFRDADIEILFNSGMDKHSGLLESLLYAGKLVDGEKRGQLKYGDKVFQKKDLLEFIEANPDILTGVKKKSKGTEKST